MLANILQMSLELEGYKVITAQRGEAALDFIRRKPPDLITLDLRLPDMDGHFLLDTLQQVGSPCSIPVVILSGGHYRACETDGVVAVLAKPFAIAHLNQVVNTILSPQPSALGLPDYRTTGGYGGY